MGLLALVLTFLLLLLLLLASCWAAGWLLLGRRAPQLLLHPILPAAGLALVGQAAWLLALCGSLRRSWALAALVALHAAAAPGWRALARRLRASRPSTRRAGIFAGAALLGVVPALLLGIYPPNAFDETTYHLSFARAMARTGALPWELELRVPTFPVLAEAVQAPLLWLGGARAAHVEAALALALAAALLLAWGAEAASATAGWIAAALWLGSPLVVYLGGTDYTEPPLALLVTVAIYCAWRSARASVRAAGAEGSASGEGEPPSALRWAAASGLLAAAAAAVKYLGIYAIAVVVLYALLAGGARLARATAAAATAALVALPPYLRLWSLTGNPVFPFLPAVFGRSYWTVGEPARPLGEALLYVLRLPYLAVLDRGAAGLQPPLSPAFLLSLPLLALLAVRCRSARPALLVMLGYMPLLVVSPADVRYLLVVLPLWSLLVGAALVVTWPTLATRRGWATAAVLVAIAPGVLYAPFQMHRLGPIPTGVAAAEAFYAAQLRGYAALSAIERRAGGRAVVYAIDGEPLHGVARVRLLGAWAGPWQYEWIAGLLGDPARLSAALRGSGATHLLLPSSLAGPLLDPRGSGRFRLVLRARDFAVLAVLPPSGACAPGVKLPGGAPYSSTCMPSSTTRLGGRLK